MVQPARSWSNGGGVHGRDLTVTSSTPQRGDTEPDRQDQWRLADADRWSVGERADDAVAALLHGPLARQPRYSEGQRETLVKAGQLIIEWAVEVARYEADIDWQWAHRDDDDPAVTASALARLIRDSREVVGRAEALLVAALADSAP